MNNLLLRSLTGLIYVALIVCSILFGGMWGFTALLALFAVLSTMEFHSLCDSGHKVSRGLMMLDIAGSLIAVAAPAVFTTLSSHPSQGPIYAFAVIASAYLIYLIARLITQLYITSGISPVTALGCSLSSQLYIALPLACASMIYILSSPAMALTMFVMV